MFEQFYHTRCRAEESVIGQEEFSVRAASLSAEQIMARRLHLELADLAIYELPTSSRNRIPGNDENAVGRPPVRLARVKMRSGTEAVVHSVVRTDPQRVYFSHIILPHDGTAALPASECVSLWGLQSMWGSETGCVWTEPQGLDISRSKTLPHWAPPGEDVQPIVSPEAVRRFLEGEPVAIPSGNASYLTTFWLRF